MGSSLRRRCGGLQEHTGATQVYRNAWSCQLVFGRSSRLLSTSPVARRRRGCFRSVRQASGRRVRTRSFRIQNLFNRDIAERYSFFAEDIVYFQTGKQATLQHLLETALEIDAAIYDSSDYK